MRIYETWGSEEMKAAFGRLSGLEIKDNTAFESKHGAFDSPQRSSVWVDIDRIGWFFNGVGFLVHRRIANVNMIDELFGYGVIFVWEKIRPLVEGWRKKLNVPKSFVWFEYLYNVMKAREKKVSANPALR